MRASHGDDINLLSGPLDGVIIVVVVVVGKYCNLLSQFLARSPVGLRPRDRGLSLRGAINYCVLLLGCVLDGLDGLLRVGGCDRLLNCFTTII